MTAPLSPQARRRIEQAHIRLELTAEGRRQLGLHLTARDLARGALRRGLDGTPLEHLIEAHLGALAAQGIRPRPHAVSGMRAHLRRLLGRRRSNHPTTPEACR
ncbi:MAG: hypothetical protein KJ067_07215 [Vicinamibacteria bacterium]|nr:hypothetical protein [Vicinamibacteria bacterium]